ncbi:uncharacterized protein SCHCODRAFT_02582896 [Schizophyllum commune H4-8]|nr:uncharacterized protein SCHCODRAFT_02582896 [Schizophyllum commune H4-8]KAI5890201.1 hypothetical protein SCHCODRAFT_02582896 [Schizophyllum commune H4-8]
MLPVERAQRPAPLAERAAPLTNLQLLRSGHLPSAEDAEALQNIIIDLESIAGFLKEDIRACRSREALALAAGDTAPRTASHLDPLREERTRVQKLLRLCKAVIAPIRKLPTEIMVEIFERVLDNVDFLPDDLHSISTVNFTWRAIVLSTPQLWSTVLLHFFAVTDYIPVHRRFAIARAQLRWSADWPIRLRVLLYDKHAETVRTSEVWKELCAQSYRWKVAEIRTSSSPTFWHDHPPLSLPALETLTLINTGPLALFVILADAPCLRNLSIFHSHQEVAREVQHLPTLTLTSLSLQAMLLTDCLYIIRQSAPSLQTMEIMTSAVTVGELRRWQSLKYDEPVELPALQTLRLVNDNTHRFLCQSLTVPALHDLAIVDLHLDFCDVPSILQMVHRSSALVTTFSVRPSIIAPISRRSRIYVADTMVKLLQGLPTIIELKIDAECRRDFLTDSFFRDLTPSPYNSNPALPDLRYLSVVVSILEDRYDDGERSLEDVTRALHGFRATDCVVNGILYPALERREITRSPIDIYFDDENLNSIGVQKESDENEKKGDCSDSEGDTETDYTMDDSDEESSDDAF